MTPGLPGDTYESDDRCGAVMVVSAAIARSWRAALMNPSNTSETATRHGRSVGSQAPATVLGRLSTREGGLG